MSEPLLNSSTSNTPSANTQLQVLKEQLLVVRAKCNAKGTKAAKPNKSDPKLSLGKENAKPVKKHGKVEKSEVPEVKKEEKDCVFGFSVGDVDVTVGDLNAIEVCHLLVPEIFKDSKMAPEKLAFSIKAHIATYNLGEIGHGLIESSCESEITTEQIEKKFKWCKCLHALLSSSPVHDLSGLTNRAKANDDEEESEADKSKAQNDEDMDVFDDHSPSPSQNLRGSSPPWNDEEIDSPMPPLPAPPAPAASQPKGPSETPKVNTLKHKHPLKMLKDINESSKLEREKLRIAAEKERDFRQLEDAHECCEHEHFMAEKQLEMLRLQAAVIGAGGTIPELPNPELPK
ncbi:hypothetical protein CPB84DRAFT_1749870 [Gymnopilus junonius]|uniref:Uncharacterized protein n=1 Tax=Gymnopilus junonius TaxID=109634 RepID=A0A9P5NHQ0_GYMJU|nr:hypothetical protein CPB84DRAFT_1749870 [Gymnopilus junonius]